MSLLIYGMLLLLGVVLLGHTVARVLLGGIADPVDRTRSDQAPPRGAARRILDERYAAGELSTEGYQRQLRVLEERN